MSIQSSINSMIGSASHAVMAVKGYQALKNKKVLSQTQSKNMPITQPTKSIQAQAAERAKQNAADEVEAKMNQRDEFMEYLKKQPTSLGGTVGDLPQNIQSHIAKQYSPEQRLKLLKEAKNGGNK